MLYPLSYEGLGAMLTARGHGGLAPVSCVGVSGGLGRRCCSGGGLAPTSARISIAAIPPAP